ncbi:YdeI/OmpD-associated family protein [Psychrosphaera sp. 1_MG-2023]|uniref:YdeI/OmpD-associated family protein n=1 Tax=Psychrosphaera sp. 1_MG-2023 TaxID=3062643 RepID=UPI0026E453CB|nr:YdeI/OmpD-associated family protein [Psychrosphaera sp. 1_MG-2023]MDO6719056.1 YdeI/OmpD-associated family protein [Psychrosphaera sp. 1_MG-2023]
MTSDLPSELPSELPPNIVAILEKSEWQDERKLLREILLNHDLEEDVKWGNLCYTHNNSNVALIYCLKDYCAIGFLKGVLLKDTQNLLQKPGPNSQSAKWMRFNNKQDIKTLKTTLDDYIKNAIDVERAGLKVDFKEKNELIYPTELLQVFQQSPELEVAFENLTPGRKRGYILHFTGAKQSKTRTSRINKCVAKIMSGKGFNER